MAKVTFGQKLKALRDTAGLSQDQLSIECGVNVRSIHAYEQGQRAPSAENLFKIAEALGAECTAFKECVFVRADQNASRIKPKPKKRL